MSEISDAMAALMAVTRLPRGMDATAAAALTMRFKRIMSDYHEDVSLKALDDWPRKNQFFPTEPEFRKALDEAHAALRSRRDAPPYDDGMSQKPTGATRAFIEDFRKRWPEKCDAWFSGDVTRFSETRIGTRLAFLKDRVERKAPGLMAKHGVRIVEPHRYHLNSDGTFGIEWRWS